MTTVSFLISPLPITKVNISLNQAKPTVQILKQRNPFGHFIKLRHFHGSTLSPVVDSRKVFAIAEETRQVVSTPNPSSEAARRLYIGNDELKKIVEEHGVVEKAEVLQLNDVAVIVD